MAISFEIIYNKDKLFLTPAREGFRDQYNRLFEHHYSGKYKCISNKRKPPKAL